MSKWKQLENGESAQDVIDRLKPNRKKQAIIMACIAIGLVVVCCVGSSIFMASQGAAQAAAATSTPLPSSPTAAGPYVITATSTSTLLPSPSSTPTLASSPTITQTPTRAATQTPWVIMQTSPAQVVYIEKPVYKTVVVPIVVTADPGPTQTPWIITVEVTPTETPTSTPTLEITQEPQLFCPWAL